jgi:enoyl-CoA hydratase/carnithine racemase
MNGKELEVYKMGFENLTLEKKGPLCLLTLNHPPVNAWNWAITVDFQRAIEEVANDEATRVLIVTGRGEKCFSAGLDVHDAANMDKTSPKARETWMRIDRFSKRVIAAI